MHVPDSLFFMPSAPMEKRNGQITTPTANRPTGELSADPNSTFAGTNATAKGENTKTWGRTANGSVFQVPVTRDMLENLFTHHFPPTPGSHTLIELLTLSVLLGQAFTFLLIVPSSFRFVFLFSFCFWRLAYNAGLGKSYVYVFNLC